MPFDGIVMSTLKKELIFELCDGKVERVYQPNQFDINLYIYKLGKTKKLVISANPSIPRIFITQRQIKNPEVAPNFCMILRKNLIGARITNIEQEGLERILKVEFETKNELNDTVKRYLIFEMMGRHSNIFLVDDNNKIIDAIKRISFEGSNRVILPSVKYSLPPVLTKKNPLEITYEDFEQLFINSEKSYENILTDNISGISKQFASEVIYRANISEKNLTKNQIIKRIFDSLIELINYMDKIEKINPCIYYDDGKMFDFYSFDLKIYSHLNKQSFDCVNKCVEVFFTKKEELATITEKKQYLQKIIDQNIKKLVQKQEQILLKLDQAKNSELYKKYADLILANLFTIKSTSEPFIEVVDYYSEDLKTIQIPIEKDKNIKENAEKYYKLYNKLKRTEEYAKEELNSTEQELEFLNNLDALLQKSIDMMDLQSIEEELKNEGYIKRLTDKRSKKAETKISTKAHHFISSDGFDIYVGRNNIQNDYLTHRFAADNDIWLHTQKIPGSHVIIKTNNKAVSDKTLFEAASLAAFFSKAKNSTKVPVDYTYIKYIKKPPKSKPGYVIYDNFKTLIVDSPSNINNFNKVE